MVHIIHIISFWPAHNFFNFSFEGPYPGVLHPATTGYFPTQHHGGYYPNNMAYVSSPWGKLPLNRANPSKKIRSLSPDEETNNNEGDDRYFNSQI